MTILIKLHVSSYIISIFLELFIWESWGGGIEPSLEVVAGFFFGWGGCRRGSTYL